MTKRYLLGTELHRQQNIMDEVSEEKYTMAYKGSETYGQKMAKAVRVMKSKRDAAIAEAEIPTDFKNGMFIGIVEEVKEEGEV